MNVQVSQNNSNKPFVLEGHSIEKSGLTLLQDAGRVGALVSKTLIAQILATGKLVPYTDETAVDGSAIPYGIYVGADITEADIKAGDVEDLAVLKGGSVIVDKDAIVIENAKTFATIIATGTINARSVEDELNNKGIYLGEVDSQSGFENA